MQNRFTPLEKKKNDENTTGNANAINTKPKILPLVFIYQKNTDHKGLISLITEIIGKQFHIKYTAGRTNLYAYTMYNYENLMKELTEQNIQLHTYTPKDEKTHGFVLRELFSAPEVEEIKDMQQQIALMLPDAYTAQKNTGHIYVQIKKRKTV